MAVGDRLGKDGIPSHLVPVDLRGGISFSEWHILGDGSQAHILEVLLSQDSEQESGHSSVVVRHDDGSPAAGCLREGR